MGMPREEREKRRSTARERAEAHQSGYTTTTLNVPEGISFWSDFDAGEHLIDIVPYRTGEGNPYVKQKGVLHYERTFYTYRSIGVEEKSYVCPSMTFGERDYIQEHRQEKARDPNADPDYLKSLAPKERQVFLIYDRKHPEKKLQIWEVSYHNFGKALDQRIKTAPEGADWDLFYYPDKYGMSLRLIVVKESAGATKYNKVASIDFMPRTDDLPPEIVNHGICLDDILVKLPYEELKRIFLGEPPNKGGSEETKSEAPATTRQDVPFDDGKSNATNPPADDFPPTSGISAAERGEQYDRGFAAQRQGKKRADCPWKKESPQGIAWLEGWMDAADAAPVAKEETKREPTAEELGIARTAEVGYRGKRHTVIRIGDDGLLVLMDEQDEPVRGIKPSEVEFPYRVASAAPSSNGNTAAKTSPPPATVVDEKKEDSWDKEW